MRLIRPAIALKFSRELFWVDIKDGSRQYIFFDISVIHRELEPGEKYWGLQLILPFAQFVISQFWWHT